MSETTHCGYVAIIGRPNVGKSTLLNHLLGQKISITSRKPQTTRHRILGIKTEGEAQIIYVDTPGLHQNAKKMLNRYMNRTAMAVIHDVDVVIFVVEALRWQADDAFILHKIADLKCPIIVVINKIDKVTDKESLLPYLESLHHKLPHATLLPLSALKRDNLAPLEERVATLLPPNPHFFPDGQITDANERFLASEIIREHLIKSLGQELPYALTVQIEKFQTEQQTLHLGAIIWVEKLSQKSIVIGKDGAVLKKIGTTARMQMEKLFGQKIYLQLWVKVKQNWSDNEKTLQNFGYI